MLHYTEVGKCEQQVITVWLNFRLSMDHAVYRWICRCTFLLGIKWYHHVQNDEVRRTTEQPHFFGCCPSTSFLPVRPHCANDRRNRCQDLNSCPHGELEATTGMHLYYVDEDYPASPEIQ